MAERFKAHAWKACEEQSSAGSNPVSSAKCIVFKKISSKNAVSEGVNGLKLVTFLLLIPRPLENGVRI